MAKKNNNAEMVRVEHVWSVLCGNSSVDQTSQNISLFSVFEQLNLEKKQIEEQQSAGKQVVVPINFQLVTLLRKMGAGKFAGNLKTEIVSPDGKNLGTDEHAIEFHDGKDRLRAIFSFPGMPVATAGYYEFRISLRTTGGQYEKIASVPLQILLN